MHTIPVNDDIYNGSGWAVAAILNGRVIAFEKLDHPDTSDIPAIIKSVRAQPAAAAGDRLYREWMDGPDDDDDHPRHPGSTFRIVGGMLSCGEFSYALTARERKAAGIKNKWF